MIQTDSIIQRDLAAIAARDLPWEALHGRTVLVTGATGFLGSYVVDMLAYLNSMYPEQKPIRILALARSREKLAARFPSLHEKSFFEALIQDIAEPWVGDLAIDYIFHAASLASPKYYLAAPVDTIRANVLGTMHLLELARRNHARLLFLSSGAVYGEPLGDSDEIGETDYGPLDPLDARSCYGESKRLGEAACLAYWREYQVPALIARVSHTYGPGIDLSDGRIFSDVVASVLSGENVRLHGDGLASRPFCYVSDMVAGLFLLLFRGQPGEAYNIGATEEMTVRELAELVIRISGEPGLQVVSNTAPGTFGQAARSSGHFNIDKIRALGWVSKTSPEEGFRKTLAYFRQAKASPEAGRL